MKKLLLIVGVVVVVITGTPVALVLWAATGNLSSAEYEAGWLYELEGIPAATPDGTYTIITYNVGYASGLTNNSGFNASAEQYEENMGKIVDALEPVEPDFVASQEIDFDCARSHRQDQSRLIAEGLGLRYRADALNWDNAYVPWPYGWPSANFGRMVSGHAVASRFPIASHSKITLAKPEENPFWYNMFYIDRIIQVVEVDVGGQPLVILNVHLEAYKRKTRQQQGEVVAATVRQFMDKPLILLGDFNARPPWQTEETTLASILAVEGLHKEFPQEAYGKDDEARLYTSSSGNPRKSIDHIFYNDKIRCVSARVLQDAGTGSDHLPVMMEFQFN